MSSERIQSHRVLSTSLWYNIFVRKLTLYYPIIGESLDIVSTLVHLEPYLSISIIKGNDQWKRSTTNANISLCCFSIIHYLLHVATIIFCHVNDLTVLFLFNFFSFQSLCGYIFIFKIIKKIFNERTIIVLLYVHVYPIFKKSSVDKI